MPPGFGAELAGTATRCAQGAQFAISRRLTVCYPLAGDALGGSHVSLRGLLEELDPAAYRVLVVPELRDGKLARFFSGFEQVVDPAPPLRSFRPGQSFGPVQAARTFAGLRRRAAFLRAQGVDIVHTNDGRSHASWALAARIAKVRLLWHHRGDPGARGLRYVAPLLADRIVAVSSFALPRGQLGAAASASVIHSPFDVSITADRVRMRKLILDATGAHEDTLICGYSGAFVERKRPLDFVAAIEALGRISDRPVVGAMFGLARDPKMEARLDAAIRAMRGPARVERLGWRTPGHEWLAGCDMLLVPAVDEPLGRTLVEAMLVGTPVVAVSSGGNPEALEGGCGVLVEPGDANAMALVAEQLSRESVMREGMVERARLAARQRFSRQNHASRVIATYHALA